MYKITYIFQGEYHLRRFTLKADLIPAYIPYNKYKVDLSLYQIKWGKKYVAADVTAYVNFRSKK